MPSRATKSPAVIVPKGWAVPGQHRPVLLGLHSTGPCLVSPKRCPKWEPGSPLPAQQGTNETRRSLQVEIKFAVAQPMVLRAESSYSKGAVQLEVLGAAWSIAPLLLFALWK